MQEKNTNERGVLFERLVIGGAVVLGVAIVILAIVFGKGSFQNPASSSTKPASDGRTGLEIRDEAVLGNPQASSTIVEFLDFQCSACGIFFGQIESQIRARYIDTGKAKMVVKVLSFIDGYNKKGESYAAARAALCAREQSGFWKMHDAIFSAEWAEISAKKNNENNGNLTRDAFVSFAKKSGLNTTAFTACYDSIDKYVTSTEEYMKDITALLGDNIGTPTVFINGTQVQNAFDLKEYEELIK